jgi:TonB family protein
MLGVLMESKAKGQRRAGGALLSVAFHLAIIGAVAATTVHGTTPPTSKPKIVTVHYVPPVVHTPVMRTPPLSHSTLTSSSIAEPMIPRIAVPTIVPRGIPPIDAAIGFSTDSITAPVDRGGNAGTGVSRGLTFGDEGAGNSAWRGNELLMHILTPARPRYPESLRQAQIDGHVVVRFTVDTTGRVDASSIQIVTSTHDLFTRAVREALGNFRFKPAEVGGRRVAALAEMPFEFQISR